jgi:DNA (cytosine-5)-methyltransferase 1
VIILENVEEFKTWGPLLKDGKPDTKQKGRTFNAFINALKRQGYKIDFRELRACDYGAPTIRKRLFLIARCDGRPIRWPEPTHDDPARIEVHAGAKKPWRTAAEIIDWSLPCPSIFERKRPLAENTMRRIARGIQRFVIENPRPFIIPIAHYNGSNPAHSVDEPLRTVTANPKGGHFAVVNPTLIQIGYGEREGQKPRVPGLNKPLGTVVAGGQKHALVAAFLHKYHGQKYPEDTRGQVPSEPLRTLDTSNRYSPAPTITAGGLYIGEVRAFLLKYYGSSTGQDCREPLHTLTAKHRIGLVTVHGQDYQIVDIGMRMLEPHELFAAQGFPASYIIDRDGEGNKFSKAVQVALCGNSVPPALARVLVRSNLPEMCGEMCGAESGRDKEAEISKEAKG